MAYSDEEEKNAAFGARVYAIMNSMVAKWWMPPVFKQTFVAGRVLRAEDLAQRAIESARRAVPEGGSNGGPRDAMRHCIWSCLLARYFGPDVAKAVTDAWEAVGGNTENHKKMDWNNNGEGRKCAETDRVCYYCCREKLRHVGLWIMPDWKKEGGPTATSKARWLMFRDGELHPGMTKTDKRTDIKKGAVWAEFIPPVGDTDLVSWRVMEMPEVLGASESGRVASSSPIDDFEESGERGMGRVGVMGMDYGEYVDDATAAADGIDDYIVGGVEGLPYEDPPLDPGTSSDGSGEARPDDEEREDEGEEEVAIDMDDVEQPDVEPASGGGREIPPVELQNEYLRLDDL